MTLEEAITVIKTCSAKMKNSYGSTVFDEWVITQFLGNKATTLYYDGPRPNEFKKHFAADVKELETHLLSHSYVPGDFEFCRSAGGTQYEAFMVIGRQIYLLCNNTSQTMESIAKNEKWLAAQVPFHEMTHQFRSNPLVIPIDQENKPA